MNFRKNSILIIGSGIALVLLAAATVFLFKYRGSYVNYGKQLKEAEAKLTRLNSRNPYPSQENVELAQENLDVLKQKYDSVRESLIRRQVSVEAVEPAGFAPLLEQSYRRVTARAEEAGVTLGDNIDLGFAAYAAGEIPSANPKVMNRLVLQLGAIEDLCMLMIDAKVQSIDDIERTMFETDPVEEEIEDPRASRRRPSRRDIETPGAELVMGLPAPQKSDLYTIERIAIEFTGWESSVWNVLNRLAASGISYDVIDVEFENTNKDVGSPVDLKSLLSGMAAVRQQGAATAAAGMNTFFPGAAGMTMAAPSLDSIPHEERIVGGREPIKLSIMVDMYHFTTDEETAEVRP